MYRKGRKKGVDKLEHKEHLCVQMVYSTEEPRREKRDETVFHYIKYTHELRTKYKSQDIMTVIKIRTLEWLGHVSRMNETRSVKKIFEGKLEGRRGRGRPRLRWINDVEDDLRKLGVKRWRTKALNREEWASIIREAKAKLKGP